MPGGTFAVARRRRDFSVFQDGGVIWAAWVRGQHRILVVRLVVVSLYTGTSQERRKIPSPP